jgi:hypothetical protein
MTYVALMPGAKWERRFKWLLGFSFILAAASIVGWVRPTEEITLLSVNCSEEHQTIADLHKEVVDARTCTKKWWMVKDN